MEEILEEQTVAETEETDTNVETEAEASADKEPAAEERASEEYDDNRRIAEEFLSLKADFSDEITDYASLPLEVKRAAVNGAPLLTAYLFYKYDEARKLKAAEAERLAAAEKSTGSLYNSEDAAFSSDEARYRKALWQKF